MMFEISFIVFLVIFFFAAVLILCSLPGWIKIPAKFMSALFKVLIIQVISCVVLFVSIGVKRYHSSPQPLITEELLTLRPWDWQFANANFRTSGRFTKDKSILRFEATTYYVNQIKPITMDGKPKSIVAVMSWKSIDPVVIDPSRSKLSFRCKVTELEDAQELRKQYPAFPNPAGVVFVHMDTDTMLKGDWQGQDTRGRLAFTGEVE